MQEFIRKRGVTLLPGFGDPKLAALNAERNRAFAEASSQNHWRKRRKRGGA